jgi:hypothetical protein
MWGPVSYQKVRIAGEKYKRRSTSKAMIRRNQKLRNKSRSVTGKIL